MEIKAKSAEEAFNLVLDCLKSEGAESAPRGMKIKELINCCIEIENPRDRIISCPERNISMAYAFGELCWYLTGRNDLEMMKYYSKFMERGTDDGKTLNSAYGYRIFEGKHPLLPFNQWDNVKRLLSEDSDSRQAIIHLHTPNNKKTNDEVCTLSLQFLVREGKLNMITTMRSNDIVLGFTYDVFAFTMLQEILANELGLELGKYYHNAGSMHIYENKFHLLDKHTLTMLSPMEPFKNKLTDFYTMFHVEQIIRTEVEKAIKIGVFKYDAFRRITDKIKVAFEKEDLLLRFATIAFLLKAAKVLDVHKDDNLFLNYMRTMNENYADVLQYLGGFTRRGRKIVVEGIDGAGKTTCVYEMQAGTKYQIQHYCKPSATFGYIYNYLLNLTAEQDTIFDRFFISELIYAKVFGRKSNVGSFYERFLLNECKNKNVEFVFIVAKDDDQLQIAIDRLKDEDLILKDSMKKLNEAYLMMAENLKDEGFNVELREIQGGIL